MKIVLKTVNLKQSAGETKPILTVVASDKYKYRSLNILVLLNYHLK